MRKVKVWVLTIVFFSSMVWAQSSKKTRILRLDFADEIVPDVDKTSTKEKTSIKKPKNSYRKPGSLKKGAVQFREETYSVPPTNLKPFVDPEPEKEVKKRKKKHKKMLLKEIDDSVNEI